MHRFSEKRRCTTSDWSTIGIWNRNENKYLTFRVSVSGRQLIRWPFLLAGAPVHVHAVIPFVQRCFARNPIKRPPHSECASLEQMEWGKRYIKLISKHLSLPLTNQSKSRVQSTIEGSGWDESLKYIFTMYNHFYDPRSSVARYKARTKLHQLTIMNIKHYLEYRHNKTWISCKREPWSSAYGRQCAPGFRFG